MRRPCTCSLFKRVLVAVVYMTVIVVQLYLWPICNVSLKFLIFNLWYSAVPKLSRLYSIMAGDTFTHRSFLCIKHRKFNQSPPDLAVRYPVMV